MFYKKNAVFQKLLIEILQKFLTMKYLASR